MEKHEIERGIFELASDVAKCPVEGCKRPWGSAPGKRRMSVAHGSPLRVDFECCGGPRRVSLSLEDAAKLLEQVRALSIEEAQEWLKTSPFARELRGLNVSS